VPAAFVLIRPANLYYSGGNRIYRYQPNSASVQVMAGSGIYGYYDGTGPLFSAFNNPTAWLRPKRTTFTSGDSGNFRVRRMDLLQNVTTIVGNGGYYYSSMDGTGTNAAFNSVASMFSDHAGNIYFACGSCVRKMDAQTNVVTLAGDFGQYKLCQRAQAIWRASTMLPVDVSRGAMIFIADARATIEYATLPSISHLKSRRPASLQLKTYPGLQITGTIGERIRFRPRRI